MPFDLFVSYSRRDNAQGRIAEFVERISRDFEAFAGRPLRFFFDVSEIRGMDDWRHRILRGLHESRLLLACLSPSYLASEYCAWEFNEYIKNEVARALVGEGVAPIYFVDVPGWQEKDFDRHSAEWVEELRRRQHFDLRPWFAEGEHALREAEVQGRMGALDQRIAERIQRGERVEQSLGNVDAHNVHFIGRTEELRRLRETVALGKVGVLTAIHGLGGMGKTALAIEYAYAFAHEYGGGRWQVRCEGREDLVTAITMLAPALVFTDAEKIDAELQFQRILSELRRLADAREPHGCLLILDNVDRPKLLEPAQTQRLPAAEWLHVIATTRLGEHDLFARHQDRAFLAVDEMPEGDALALIEGYQPGGRFHEATERVAAQEIVRLLGRLTLAVETAAVFLGQFADDVTCRGFLERLKKEGLEGLESAAAQTSEGVLHGEKRLTATLNPTLERLNEQERLALSYAALLPADHVALPWIRALTAQQFPELGNDAEPGYPDPWRNVLRHLFSLRLWQGTDVVDGGGQPLVARMHRLLQELMRGAGGEHVKAFEPALLAYVKSRAAFLWEGWVQLDHRWELGPVVACAWRWMERGSQDGTWLASKAVRPLYVLGSFAEGETLIRQALMLDEETFGSNHPAVARDLNNLALLLQDTNRHTKAEPLLRRTLVILEQRFGPDHYAVATSLNNLAQLLQATSRLAEAEPLMRRALTIDEQSYGPDHPAVALALNNLAQLLQVTNRLAEAEPLMRRALTIDEQSYGPDHPAVALALNNLAQLFQVTNRLAEAEPLMRRALTIDEQSFGRDHPDVARDLNNLAQLLQVTNRLAEAEPLMRRALAIDEQSLGRDHPTAALALNNLAQLLQATNRLTEAEPLVRRALTIDEQSFGGDHPAVARDIINLARLLQATNRFAEAEPLMRRALTIDEQSFGSDHPAVATALNRLGLLLEGMSRLAEVEPLMRRALAIDEQSFGLDHPDVARDLNNLAQSLQATNRLAEAEPLQRRALTIAERNLGLNHPDVATSLNNLARLLQATNRLAEAEPLIRRALAIHEQSIGPDHPAVARDLTNLALLLQAMNRHSEAEPLLRRAIEILLWFTVVMENDHPHLQAAIQSYDILLRQMGYDSAQVVAELDRTGEPLGIRFRQSQNPPGICFSR